jgi:hypothetical protein
MNKNVKDGKEESSPIKIVGMMIPLLPSLMFRLTGTFIRFKSDATNAGKIFKKELIRQGIDTQTASLFTKQYVDGSNIVKSLFNGLN